MQGPNVGVEVILAFGLVITTIHNTFELRRLPTLVLFVPTQRMRVFVLLAAVGAVIVRRVP